MKSTVSKIVIAVALGLAAGASMAGDNTGNAPDGTGIEQSTELMGATNKQGDTSTEVQMKDDSELIRTRSQAQ